MTTTDPLGHPTTLTYTTPRKQVESIIDARGKTTLFTYDTVGRMRVVRDANFKTTDIEYNDRAQVTSITNALEETTSFDYDDNNRLNKIIYHDESEVNIVYDFAGRRTSVTDENGNPTIYTYDDAYRLTEIKDALLNKTTFGYDTMSNLTSQADDLGNTTNYEYDTFNRLSKIKYPLPSSGPSPRLEENFTYNDIGEIETHTDTAGRITSYAYSYSPLPTPAQSPTGSPTPSAMTRVLTITAPAPLGYVTQLTYNARMQMTKVKDALNQEYDFTYDPLGRVLTQSPRVGSTPISFGYDAVGNRTSRTDYNGNTTSYIYDNLNRLTNITYGGTSSEYATYGYDDLSRLDSAINQNGTVAFTYDNRNRLKTETDVFGHLIEYGYDDAGNRIQLKLNNAVHATYAYDDVNRLETLTDENNQNFTFGYDDANRLISKTMPNGVSSTFGYDGMSRLKRLKHTKNTTTLYDDQYAYNPANQISQITGLTQTRNFTYDNVNRLTGMTNGATTESYAYDAVGNRTSSHLTGYYYHSPFNRMTINFPWDIGYDNNGNMTSWVDSGAPMTTEPVGQRGWDRENRLTLVNVSAVGANVTYAYDALGRRISRNEDRETKFTYDGLDVLMDDYDSGSSITKYQNAPGIDNKLKQKNGSTSKYFLQDHLGSTVGFADASGTVTEENSYDSFGNPTNSSFSSRYQFTGREFDSFTGLQYSRARWYNPQIGRFISEDPIGFLGGDVNLYAYVWNNPIKFIDPMGLDGLGNDAADALDRYIDYARRSYQGDIWQVNGVVNTIADLSRMAADSLRVGSGVGDALFDPNLSPLQRALSVGTDVLRAAGLAAPLTRGLSAAGSGVSRFGTPTASCPTRRFPSKPNDLLPDIPRNAKGHIPTSENVRIRPEQHALKPGEKYNPRHHGPHYHVDYKIDPSKGWSKKNTAKAKPPGYYPGGGTGFIPGEPFP